MIIFNIDNFSEKQQCIQIYQSKFKNSVLIIDKKKPFQLKILHYKVGKFYIFQNFEPQNIVRIE